MADAWRECQPAVDKLDKRRRIEHRIGEIASRQQRLITTAQLDRLGLSRAVVSKRVTAGRLFRVRRGVYSTVPPPYSTRQLWMAAVLAGGTGTLLSDWPSAELQDFAPPDHPPSPAIHVVVPRSGGRSTSNGLVIHRRGPIDPRDRRAVDGIPVTSADLTLVHLAPQATEMELEQMIVAAESLRILKRSRLNELVDEHAGRPGVSTLRSLLALPPAEAKSRTELYLIPLYREAGLPRPEFNYPVRVPEREKPLKIDLAWPDIKLAFELDTQRFHGDWERAEEDRERDQLLGLVEWQCNRFVRRQVRERLEQAASRAARLFALRSQAMRRLSA